uniref:Complex I-MNLL n=2 Tax=Rhodnius prolixus TaxID=13249 RepID=T1I695_RHOPR
MAENIAVTMLLAIRMAGLSFVQYVALTLPVAALLVGRYLDNQETLRMTRFRDKSALYGRTLGPDEQPTWP